MEADELRVFPCTQNTFTPPFPLLPLFQWCYLLVSILYVLLRLIFSLRPDEAATVWCVQKLVYKILQFTLFQLYWRYYTMDIQISYYVEETVRLLRL